MKWIAKDGKLFSTRLRAEIYNFKLDPNNAILTKEADSNIKPKKERKIRVIKEKKRKKADPLKDKYFFYLNRSNGKNFEFDFTREEFTALLALPCYYCGGKTTGLDRVDNSKGYTWLNVEPCCYHCNMMKFTTSYEQFISRIHKIAQNHPLSQE